MSLDGGRELRVQKRLVELGWTPIMHAAASKGAADLIMAHPVHGLALIQVGTVNKALGPAARERLLDAAWLCSALPLIATPIPGVGLRVRLVTQTSAHSWPEFDPVKGLDVSKHPKGSRP